MITGFVTDSSGDPIDGVCVNAEVAGMGVVGWIATDVSGSYTLSSLPAGLNYTVFADPTCLGTGPNFLGYQGAQDTGVSVSVGVTTTAATIVLGLATPDWLPGCVRHSKLGERNVIGRHRLSGFELGE